MADTEKKKNKKKKRKYIKDPEEKKYSYKYLSPEIYHGKSPGQFTIERYQDPETMSDMQIHRAAMQHKTSVVDPETKLFLDESGNIKVYAKRKKAGKKVAKGGYVKKYAKGGGVRAARF